MYRSLHDGTEVLETLRAQARSASASGAAVDGADSDARQILATLGVWTDGTHTYTVFHREKATDSWVQVPAEQLDAAKAGDVNASGQIVVSDNTRVGRIIQLGYIGGKRWTKVDVVVAGATTGLVSAVAVNQGRLRYAGMNPMVKKFDT